MRAGSAISQQMSPGGSIRLRRCVTNNAAITIDTMQQSTVRRRRLMDRGARSVSVRAQWLSQAGCCVRAVDVVVMVDVSSVGRRLVFFRSSRSRVAREGRCLNLQWWMRRARDSARTFWHLWHMCGVTIISSSVPQYFVEHRQCIYDVYYENYYIGKWSIYLLSNTSVCYGDIIKNILSNKDCTEYNYYQEGSMTASLKK